MNWVVLLSRKQGIEYTKTATGKYKPWRNIIMIVMKFGGTSIANAKKIMNLYDIVAKQLVQKPIVVVSAMAGVTNLLIDLPKSRNPEIIFEKHREVIAQLGMDEDLPDDEFRSLMHVLDNMDGSARSMDHLISFGEILSSRIIAAYINKRGNSARAYTGWESGIITDSNFGNAEVTEKIEENIRKHLGNPDHIPVITGFIGKNEDGEITTLGRGGSDYTATLIGAALNVSEIQIWTDVDGVLTTDPSMVSKARHIPVISFTEAAELSYFGARVLHPKTLQPAIKKGIPVRILNTDRPGHEGTLITQEATDNKFTAISFKENVTVVRIYSTRMLMAYGFLAKVFEIFGKYRISIDMISTSEVSISMTLDNTENLDKAVEDLKQYGKIEIITQKALICVVGASIIEKTNVAGKIFSILGNNNINIEMISQGASHVSLNFLVNEDVLETAVKVLHRELFEKEQ